MTPEARFAAIAEEMRGKPGVEEGTGFGSSPGLRVEGKIFVMLVRGELVVKLPARRCAELVSAGLARPFERGQGRPMREWVVIAEDGENEAPDLAREALAYVR